MQNTMKATLVVNGKEFPIEIHDPKLIEEITSKNKTGYERQPDGRFWYSTTRGRVGVEYDYCCEFDNDCYEIANYYSDETVAQNNTRADALMRRLRRFAVEHRENKIEWCNHKANSFIFYNRVADKLEVAGNDAYQAFGIVYFDSKKTAELAIEEFKDELIWYFTEYKDSL